MKKDKALNKLSNIYAILGFTFLVLALVLIAIPVSPYILYRLNPDFTDGEIDNISKQISQTPIIPAEVDEKDTNLPDFDPSLPKDNYVLIPKIEVSSPIGETKDAEESLKEGTWMVPDYGTPEENSLPIILAAHRFGYIEWNRDTRNLLSFYNLPKTQIKDTVEIIWNQREYTYEIYAEDDATFIKDYDADLILYTCKYFNSPQRIFRYANRVE